MIREILLALLMFRQPASAQAVAVLPSFKDVTKEVGLNIPHISSRDKQYIVESMSGGLGLIDCDNDGKLDIIVVKGSTIEHFRQGGDPLITLYHQDAGFKFTDITQAAGLTREGWGMGVACPMAGNMATTPANPEVAGRQLAINRHYTHRPRTGQFPNECNRLP